MPDFPLAQHTNRSPKIKLMVTKSQQNTTLITSLKSWMWCTMSLSVSDKSVVAFFHNSFEAFEIPFKRNMEKNLILHHTNVPVHRSLAEQWFLQ
jgi:hypothetical protein